MKSIILFSFVSLAICGSTKKSNCPPEGFNTIKDFDVTQYMGTWHAQAQSVTSYLPKNRNYCVQAIYDLKNKETVAIDNYSNEGEVNGKISGGNFEANIPDLKNPSKLRVGPTWLPNFFKGPYWLVYAEKDQSGVYSYAIISGGAPTKEGRNGKCYAGEGNLLNFNGNGEGMWIFSRELVIEKSKLDSLKQKAEELGLDSSQLNDIENAGCLFNRSEQKLIE